MAEESGGGQLYVFDEEVIEAAVKARGLNHVETAKLLSISTRQWLRWRQVGVPVESGKAVIDLLGLPQPDLPDGVPRTPWAILEALDGISQSIAELAAGLREISARLPRDPDQH